MARPLQLVKEVFLRKCLSNHHAGDSHAPACGGAQNDKSLGLAVILFCTALPTCHCQEQSDAAISTVGLPAHHIFLTGSKGKAINYLRTHHKPGSTAAFNPPIIVLQQHRKSSNFYYAGANGHNTRLLIIIRIQYTTIGFFIQYFLAQKQLFFSAFFL